MEWEKKNVSRWIFLAVQDSSIGDIVSQWVSESVSESDFWFQQPLATPSNP